MILEKYSLNQKKTNIIVFGVLVIVLWGINRLFLQNTVTSAIVVVLITVFFLVLVWFLVNFIRERRSMNLKTYP